MSTISIPRRFNGPPDSGNGGYVCGRVAGWLPGAVSVRLRVPPPLEREMAVHVDGDEARLLDGDVVVAVARRVELNVAPPAAPTFEEAQACARTYAGFKRHPLPHCFVCGPNRAPGDGLRIFPGRTADPSVLAAPWVPDASLADASGRVAPEFLWAALDCAGAFAVLPEITAPILLGELSARLDGSVGVGEECVVVAWSRGIDGRKRYACTAVFGGDRSPVAVATATWIEVPADRVTSS
jgi:hypothetical protein